MKTKIKKKTNATTKTLGTCTEDERQLRFASGEGIREERK